MENRSFEELPPNPEENLPGPSTAQAGPSGTSRVQSSERMAPLARISDDDEESPPNYAKRYMPQEKKMEGIENLEYPAPEPIDEPHDMRQDPEFQQQIIKRRARRLRQSSVAGPCSLRPDSPSLPPLPEPEPYPDPGQELICAPIPTRAALRRLDAIYERISRFNFQFPFHTFLITWPLSTAVMGVMTLELCPMNLYLPYVMMSVGVFGTATILYRLYLIYFEKRVTTVGNESHWIALRIAEFLVWNFFTSQLVYFFEQTPSFTLGDRHYCKRRIYIINAVLFFMTSAVMLGWIVVHLAKFVNWFRRRNEPAPV